MADSKKCAHPACVCAAREDSDYCSAACESAGDADITDIACECGHAGCS